MTRRRDKLIADPPRGLRERKRADGQPRLWWEPPAAAKPLGFGPVELDAQRLSWSIGEARRLNSQASAALRSGTRRPRGGSARTMAALIDDYKRSRFFTQRAEKTQKSYAGNISIIDRKWGETPVVEFDKPVIATWYETNLQHRGATMALALNRMMSILFQHAERRGWRPPNSNPCLKIGAETPPRRDRVATWDETDALIAAADRLGRHAVAMAIALAVYQGQRRTDILKMPRGEIRRETVVDPVTGDERLEWVWTLTRSKRATEGAMMVNAEILPRLRKHIAATPAEATHLLNDEATGRPYHDGHLFSHRWSEVRKEAAKTCPSLTEPGAQLQFRDLRRTFGHRARAGGASKSDVGDVLGNTAAENAALQKIYMSPSFWTASRAITAVRRPAAETGNKKGRAS